MECMNCFKAPKSPLQKRYRQSKPTAFYELLLLGIEGSGKSTFIRQMQIIHGAGFNDQERLEFRDSIHNNIFEAMTILVIQIDRLGIEWEESSNRVLVETFQDPALPVSSRLQAVRSLWSDQGLKTCYDRRSEYESTNRINTSAQYFLDEINRISENGYLPIINDIIRARRQTRGVHNYRFRVNNYEFNITDVGGGREERLRWIEHLQNRTTCVIYMAAMDEYDSYYSEEGQEQPKNRLQESLDVFEEIQANQWMHHTTFILFLNKIDVYREKVLISNITHHFPDYPGFKYNMEDGQNFIRQKFHNLRASRRVIYHHFTEATDSTNVRVVFDAVQDTVLQMNLRFYNLM